MLQEMHTLYRGVHIPQLNLRTILTRMQDQDVRCLHVMAQNAGIILPRSANDMTLEYFQASPQAASVIAIRGKLTTQFPARPCLTVTIELQFIKSLSTYLAHMNCIEMPDAMPVAKKAGSTQAEHREVANIRYISELLGGIARALTPDAKVTSSDTVYVTKRLNDHVLWKDAHIPWRRSPKWLIIRVALQTTLAQWNAPDRFGYKVFVTYVLARALEQAHRTSIPHDVLFVMNAKIATRIWKLKMLPHKDFPFRYIAEQIRLTKSVLGLRWGQIRYLEAQPLAWSAPTVFDIKNAQLFTLPKSRKHLSHVYNRSEILKREGRLFSVNAFEASLLKDRTPGRSPPNLIPWGTSVSYPTGFPGSDTWSAILDIEDWIFHKLSIWLSSSPPSERLEYWKI